MRSNHSKFFSNCLMWFTIIVASVRTQQYSSYGHLARPQFYQYSQTQKVAAQQFIASTPANLNARKGPEVHVTTQIAQASEQFAFEVIYAIAQAVQNYDLNFVIAPFSVWSLMVLLAEGATEQTLVQLKNVLHLPNDLTQLRTAYNDIQYRLQTNTTAIELTANQGLFSNINQPLDNKYISTLSRDYRIEHVPVDFRNASVAAQIINDYISVRTQGRIENVVHPEDLIDIHLLLSSSIFFRAQWRYPFNISQTVEQPFYRENGDYVAHVPMMTQKNIFRYVTISSLSATFIELPYGEQNRFAMLLVYPHSTLTSVFQQLRQSNAVAKIHEELDRNNNNDADDDDMDIVELILPKFKIDSDLELRTVFEHLGISDLFDPTKAKLTKISRQLPNLHVSRVFHKAIIDVDEVGTVAAAVSIAPISNRIVPKYFIFDRPFCFLITDHVTNTLLFSGQIRHPMVSK